MRECEIVNEPRKIFLTTMDEPMPEQTVILLGLSELKKQNFPLVVLMKHGFNFRKGGRYSADILLMHERESVLTSEKLDSSILNRIDMIDTIRSGVLGILN